MGSVFHAVLNRLHGQDTRRAEEAAADVRAVAAQRVLVIKDDPQVPARMVTALSEAGFDVDAASDGPYALRGAHDTAYAALILDLRLPDRTGFELLGDIRDHGASQYSPVIGLAVATGEEGSATFAVANVLCKPLRSDEIRASMSRLRMPAGDRTLVVVIDDDNAALDLMRATLKSIGIDTVWFQDARVALSEIQKHRPDAIVRPRRQSCCSRSNRTA